MGEVQSLMYGEVDMRIWGLVDFFFTYSERNISFDSVRRHRGYHSLHELEKKKEEKKTWQQTRT